MPNSRLDETIANIPRRYPGPGGALAILRDGKLLAHNSWGWADTQRRIPFTPQTMFLICSISKQFTCSLLLDQFPDPTVLNDDIKRRLPNLTQPAPGIFNLAHNQSGLRDYWALTALCGSPVEAPFTPDQATALIARARTLHFQPGTRYSYCNQNFRLIGEMIEQRAGRPLAELLRTRIFDRAAMPHAALNPDTASIPGGTIGYEGTVESGFRPAVNRITWTGDAGISACLDDMIAWETHIDATRNDPAALYSRLSAPVSFTDGTQARYGFGLARGKLLDRPITSHGGGLRGWRSFRCYAPAERVSIVVLFNHMADPHDAAEDLFAALLDEPARPPPPTPEGDWTGTFEEPETGLAVRLESLPGHRLRMHYAPNAEILTPTTEGHYADGPTRLRREADGIWMDRPTDHQSTRLTPCTGDAPPDIAPPDIEGTFHAPELDATLTCTKSGGALYGAFSGTLGQGAMEPLIPFASDTWLMPCPRALDSSAPGNWTLKFQRNETGRVSGVHVGCWLARGVAYERVGA